MMVSHLRKQIFKLKLVVLGYIELATVVYIDMSSLFFSKYANILPPNLIFAGAIISEIYAICYKIAILNICL